MCTNNWRKTGLRQKKYHFWLSGVRPDQAIGVIPFEPTTPIAFVIRQVQRNYRLAPTGTPALNWNGIILDEFSTLQDYAINSSDYIQVSYNSPHHIDKVKLEAVIQQELFKHLPIQEQNAIHKLDQITGIDLKETRRVEFNEEEGTFLLNLSNCNLSQVPPCIKDFHKLRRLDLSNNYLSVLPKSLGILSDLWTLNLAHNTLKDLPENLHTIPGLDDLDVMANDFPSIPLVIGHMPRLQHLCLGSNPLPLEEAQLLKECGGWLPRGSDQVPTRLDIDRIRAYLQACEERMAPCHAPLD
jgi:hypothetical protein